MKDCCPITHTHTTYKRGCSHGVMVKAMDCRIIGSKFKVQLCFYVHFWTKV